MTNNDELNCVMGGHFEGSEEVSECIYPDCKCEMCFVYQMKILEVPVYDNRDRGDNNGNR